MAGKGGKRQGAGRKKGIPNKLTTDVKQAILKAFDEVGGASWLVELAGKDAKAFCTLLGKTVPVPVSVGGDPENPLQLKTRVELVVIDANSKG